MVYIGSSSCVSQRVFVCTGNHDFRSKSFQYRNQSIYIGSRSWIGASVFICPGTYIYDDVVVTANCTISGYLLENSIYSGNTASFVAQRYPS